MARDALSTLFAPYCVAGALHSGLAMALVLLIPLRKIFHLEDIFTHDVFDKVAQTIILIVAYSSLSELFIALYNGKVTEKGIYIYYRAVGDYAISYWIMQVCNTVVSLLFFFRKVRSNLVLLVVGAICFSAIAYGLFLYFAVGDKGMPSWDYRIIKDVPAESPYSTATANPDALVNPLPKTPEAIELGKARYATYCVHCHGPNADGKGTVGQSFAPLPSDLKSPDVQTQTAGMLFYKISLGFQRHPPLAHTIRPEYRWAIIDYLRSLPGQG